MPARTARTRARTQPGNTYGAARGAANVTPFIAGAAPTATLREVTPNTQRQGSQRLHPLHFAFPQPPKQAPPPSNPADAPRASILPALLAAGLDPEYNRYLATLALPLQRLIADEARTSTGQIDQITADRLINSILTLAITPGAPTPEDIKEAAADILGVRPGTPYSEEELDEARNRFQAGGGTDAPEPSDQELFGEAAKGRSEVLEDRGLILPIFGPPPWAPSENLPPPEAEGE